MSNQLRAESGGCEEGFASTARIGCTQVHIVIRLQVQGFVGEAQQGSPSSEPGGHLLCSTHLAARPLLPQATRTTPRTSMKPVPLTQQALPVPPRPPLPGLNAQRRHHENRPPAGRVVCGRSEHKQESNSANSVPLAAVVAGVVLLGSAALALVHMARRRFCRH